MELSVICIKNIHYFDDMHICKRIMMRIVPDRARIPWRPDVRRRLPSQSRNSQTFACDDNYKIRHM